MRPNLHESAELVTFTEEILTGKLLFLYSVSALMENLRCNWVRMIILKVKINLKKSATVTRSNFVVNGLVFKVLKFIVLKFLAIRNSNKI